jgi:O-methyltransferase/methyltransferase family protein
MQNDAHEQGDEQSAATLMRMVNGFQVSQAIHVAATLGIADLLKDGPRAADDLAAATDTDSGALYRLLRTLAAVGVLREEPERSFALTPLGDCLCADAPYPVRPWAIQMGQLYYWDTWGHLLQSVQSGENAFRSIHGMDVWEYRKDRPEVSVVFDHAMTAQSQRAAAAVLAAYDFSRFSCIVDVGGGQGALLAAILSRYSSMHGVLLDQAHAVAGSEKVLGAAGVADRCRVIAGSFFEEVPEGADAYVLKAILHDWEDEEAVSILQTCRRAMGPQGTLLVIERVVGPRNEDAAAKLSDLNMLVMPGGKERTCEEFDELFEKAGFHLADAIRTGAEISVIEGHPV